MTVSSLELVEVGPYLDLVLGAFEKVVEDGAALRGSVDVLEEPRSPAGPVEETVALDVLRLTVNLGKSEGRRERNKGNERWSFIHQYRSTGSK